MAEKMDRIKQHRVLGRYNVGRRNKSEDGKNNDAKQRDGCGPGLLFLHNKLRCIGDLELAFQNALEECGTEEVTAAELYERIMEGEEAQKKFKGLKKPQVHAHLQVQVVHWGNLRLYHGPQWQATCC